MLRGGSDFTSTHQNDDPDEKLIVQNSKSYKQSRSRRVKDVQNQMKDFTDPLEAFLPTYIP